MWCFDIYEEAEWIVVEGDLPGFEQEDLTLFGDDSRLVLSGRRRDRAGAAARTYFHRERRLATLHREIQLPRPVRAEAGEVTLRQGVLRVRLPKAMQAGAGSLERPFGPA
jgi:HSP20 family protein